MDSHTPDKVAALADVFRLMGDGNRLRVLMLVRDEPRPVGEIAAATGLSPSLASHHLRLLRAGRLVRAERRGKHVYYALDDAHVRRVLNDMADHMDEDAVAALRPDRAAG